MDTVVRACQSSDASRICEIYNYYVLNTVVTFEEEPVTDTEMHRRIAEVTQRYPWLVAEENGTVVAYAYATPWKPRSAYRYAAEATIYVASNCTHRGIGTRLYKALIDEIKGRDVHCIVGGIALPNHASITLHENLGFAKIAQFKEIGRKRERWVDVGYWELILADSSDE